MAIYDISLSISQSLVVWPDHPPIRHYPARHTWIEATGRPSAVWRSVPTPARMWTHRLHFVPGAAGVDVMDLELLVGPSLVVHCLEVDAISAGVLEDCLSRLAPIVCSFAPVTLNAGCGASGL